MSRHDRQRLDDVLVAITAIREMRDRLAHHYFDTSHAILTATVQEDLPGLEKAVKRLVKLAGSSP